MKLFNSLHNSKRFRNSGLNFIWFYSLCGVQVANKMEPNQHGQILQNYWWIHCDWCGLTTSSELPTMVALTCFHVFHDVCFQRCKWKICMCLYTWAQYIEIILSIKWIWGKSFISWFSNRSLRKAILLQSGRASKDSDVQLLSETGSIRDIRRKREFMSFAEYHSDVQIFTFHFVLL